MSFFFGLLFFLLLNSVVNLNNLYVYVLDNGCHESVGKYKCSYLEDWYSGVTEIIEISNDGKTDRVELDCKTNTKQIKELF